MKISKNISFLSVVFLSFFFLLMPAFFAHAATIDITDGTLIFLGDSGNDNMTVSISGSTYNLTDSVSVFTTVPVGWTGIGTNTSYGPEIGVTSIIINGGDGNDIINIRSNNDAITVVDGNGNDITNISSNAPSNTGNLDGIMADVVVNGGTGTDNLVMSDYSAPSGNGAVSISGGTVAGLASANIMFSGTFSKVRVITSNTPGLAESVMVDSPANIFQLDTNAGADTVSVLSTAYAFTLNTGAGNDSVTLGNTANLNGILAAISIDEGSGANSLTMDDSTGGSHAVSVTNTKVSNFAPVDVSFKALGGTLALNLIDGAASTVDIGPHSSLLTINLIGDWTEI